MKIPVVASLTITTSIILSLFPQSSVAEDVKELAPPSFEVVDIADVNVATGQLSPSLTDVKIGGDRGLAHQLSSYTSNFVNWEGGPLGFTDNYNGRVYRTEIYRPHPYSDTDVIYSMRVSDGETTADFEIVGNGEYEAFGDPRYELEWEPGEGYLLTKPDGTKVYYSNSGGVPQSPPDEANISYSMVRKVHPNGFTVYVHSAGTRTNSRFSVVTNTGYQLKYVYEPHNRPIDPSKANFQPDNSFLPSADSGGWLSELPRYIYGINRSYEYCEHGREDCGLSMDWPKATHTWPDGMPRAAYIGESEFSVTDAEGRTTEFHQEAYDIAVDENGNEFPGYLDANTHFRPRITKIKYPDGSGFTYDYRNEGTTTGAGDPFSAVMYMPGNEAALYTAKSLTGDDERSYSTGNPYPQHGQQHHVINRSSGYKSVNHVVMNTRYHSVAEVDTESMSVDLDPHSSYDWRVKRSSSKLGEGSTKYEYDDRGNVIKKTVNGISTTADYPNTCTSNNRKYCNKPTWVKDAKGNKTSYEYHQPSGQVKKVERPQDDRGISPTTHYSYEEKYAYIKDESGSREQIDDPIWLLVEEWYCTDSQSSQNSCPDGDRVKTTYKYDNDNLHRTGKEVYSQQDNETRVECYQYDRFGNRVGTIEPKAEVTDCN